MSRTVQTIRATCALAWLLLLLAGHGVRAVEQPVEKDGEKKTDEKKSDEEDEDDVKVAKPAQTPAQLIQLLKEGDFDQRQQAVQGLKVYSEEAREALDQAAKEENDLEVRETAQRLLGLLSRATIRIEALDRSGNAMPGLEADVSFYDFGGQMVGFGRRNRQMKNITTDKEGIADVKGIAPGQVNVNVNWKSAFISLTGKMLYQIKLHQGENRIQYVLTKGARLRAKIVDAETGKPIENASFSLVYNQGLEFEDFDVALLQNGANGLINAGATGNSDAKGDVVVEKIQGQMSIGLVRSDDYVPLVLSNLTIRDDEETVIAEPIKLSLKAKTLGSIKVRLMDGDKPIAKGKAFVESDRSDLPLNRRANAMMRMQWGMQQEAEQEADEKGVIELKDLRPGTYRISVHRQGMTPVVLNDVKVETGQATSVDVPKPGPGGKIAGKILNAAGKGLPNLQIVALPIAEVQDLSNSNGQLQNIFWYRRQRFGGRVQTEHVTTNAEGSYEVKGLAPDTYVILTFLPGNRLGLVCGVKVEEGKSAAAPELKIPAKENEGAKHVTSFRIAGTVLKPDGTPVEAGNLVMMYRYMGGMSSGSWSMGLSKGGKFDFNRSFTGDDYASMEPYRLIVRISGFKPANIDLTKEGLNLNNLDVRLEKQSFAKARFTVKDESGAPLKGVRVTPVLATNRNYLGRVQTPAKVRATNEKGEVAFIGLASGKRSFTFEMNGYYLESPLELELVEEGETNQVVTMKKALTVSGKVEIPSNIKPSSIVLVLRSTDQNMQIGSTSGLDAEGRYHFENLQPGTYDIFTAHPCLTMVSKDGFTLEKQSLDLPVKLDTVGGAMVSLGNGARNSAAWITEPGAWDPSNETYKAPGRQNAKEGWFSADDKGMVRIFGVPAGTYDLVVTESDFIKRNVRVNRFKKSQVRFVVPGVKVVSLPNGYADLEKLPPVTATFEEGTASVNGVLKMKERSEKDESLGRMNLGSATLMLVGERLTCTESYNLPADFSARNAPIIVGEVPEDLKVRPANQFFFDKLPPGEYRIYLSMNIYNQFGRVQTLVEKKAKEEAEKAMLLKTFKVEAGKALDVGPLEIDFSDTLRESLRNQAEAQMDMNFGPAIGDDEPEVIRP